MVEATIAASPDGRTRVTDERVLEAMRQVPRHRFAGKGNRTLAHGDTPLPIGHGQTISQPYIVALMTEALQLEATDKVLEIGTGSGYQAAVLSELTPHVYTIEIIEPLAQQARKRFDEWGYATITTKQGDGYWGWAEHAPFDAIIVTCAAAHLPPPLWEQLRPGGRIVVPLGSPLYGQSLTIITKTEAGERQSEVITLCRFVPMTGKLQER
jgi:protein-L-isoaspartate(D-aspartate) O-methyltransferase